MDNAKLTKLCPLCECEKPAAEFWASKNTKDGLYSWCKPCTKARRKERYDPEYHRNYRLERLEAKREYDRMRYQRDPEKRNAGIRRWYRENKDKVKAQRARYNAEHRQDNLARNRKRKARLKEAEGSHTAAEVWALAESQDWLCAYCETPMFGEFHVDHMLPISRGGSNSWENLAITCATCNLRKNDKTGEEFCADFT